MTLIALIPAAWAAETDTVEGIVAKFQNEILIPIISLLFVLATVFFLWGVMLYVVGSRGDPARLEKGKKVVLWGIVGMAIMASAWGVVRLICNYFGTCGASSASSLSPSGSSGSGSGGGFEEPPFSIPAGGGSSGSSKSGSKAEEPPKVINIGGQDVELQGGGGVFFRTPKKQ